MDPGFVAAVLETIQQDRWAADPSATNRRLVMEQFRKMVANYDTDGGKAVRYIQESIYDLCQYGVSKYETSSDLSFNAIDDGWQILSKSGEVLMQENLVGLDYQYFPLLVTQAAIELDFQPVGLRGYQFLVDQNKPLEDQPVFMDQIREMLQIPAEEELSGQELVAELKEFVQFCPEFGNSLEANCPGFLKLLLVSDDKAT